MFSEEQRGCRKGYRGTTELLYIDKHILNESKTRRKNLAMALYWLQKGIWYDSAELDNKLHHNAQNTTWNHKLHRENHENLESGIDSRRKKLSWNKDPKRHISRRRTITFTIHNCHDTTLPQTQKMDCRIQI